MNRCSWRWDVWHSYAAHFTGFYGLWILCCGEGENKMVTLTDPFYPTIFERVLNIMNENIKRVACEYEYSESWYGAGDALPCGRDAIGVSPEHERPRCQLHLLK